MNFVEILISAIVSSVISVIFSTALVVFLLNKVQLSINLRDSGIKRIYAKGQSVKSFEKKLNSYKCKEIKVLGFSAYGFSHVYRNELTKFVARGGNIIYLLSKTNTEFIKDASEMEGRGSDEISKSVDSALEIIKCIYSDAKNIASKHDIKCGVIRLRFYDTEIRNQLILCTDIDNNVNAWMTILLPPLAAVNCKMIEYSEADDCVQYFDTIWKRHEADEYNFMA